MPNHYMYRPSDPVETAAAYAVGISCRNTPTTIALTRQKTTILKDSSFEGAKKGMYVLSDNSKGTPDMILIGTGSETELVVNAAVKLRQAGTAVRVVSAPCVDRFEEQDASYQANVFPPMFSKDKILVCEAATSWGWHKYASTFVCVDGFGISAPTGEKMRQHYGLTVSNVVTVANAMGKTMGCGCSGAAVTTKS